MASKMLLTTVSSPTVSLTYVTFHEFFGFKTVAKVPVIESASTMVYLPPFISLRSAELVVRSRVQFSPIERSP